MNPPQPHHQVGSSSTSRLILDLNVEQMQAHMDAPCL
jgi:hypothetical protein